MQFACAACGFCAEIKFAAALPEQDGLICHPEEGALCPTKDLCNLCVQLWMLRSIKESNPWGKTQLAPPDPSPVGAAYNSPGRNRLLRNPKPRRDGGTVTTPAAKRRHEKARHGKCREVGSGTNRVRFSGRYEFRNSLVSPGVSPTNRNQVPEVRHP
jgi:hypothetical protein